MAKKKAAAESAAPAPQAGTSAAEYTVLARRYRPQQFGDLVGQEPIAQALGNALQSNRVAHAYLFTGARGVGKTSTARILAKALNCEKGPTITPCGQCDLCQAIAAGEDMDVLEIDGASNRGIDEVREIRQNVGFRPSRARYKIYIIDEVHMLTAPAFNALLKTLEEPPPHVKFIFATTEVQKIPVTILSRCQRFDFAGIGLTRIVERLQQIVAAEGMQAESEALELVARRAGGSMRDAQSLLDQLLAFGGESLTVELVHQLLGTANDDRVAALARSIVHKDAAACLELVRQTADQGLNLGEVLDQMIDYWRDLMVVHSAGIDGPALSVAGKLRQALKEQAQQLSLETILAGLDVLVSAKNRLRTTSHQRVVLEMSLVRLCRLDDLVSLSQLTKLLTSEGAAVPNSRAHVAPAASATASAVAPSEKKKLTLDHDPDLPVQAQPLNASNLNNVWQQVVTNVGFTVGSELKKATSLAISGPNALVIAFPAGYNRGEQFLDSARLARVEEAIAKLTGQAWAVRLNVQEAPEQGAAAHVANDAESAGVRSRRQRDEVGQHPLVAKAKDLLGAQVMGVDEGFGVIFPAAAAAPEVAASESDAAEDA